jgi:threonylcarbamoyladenosine tRNA methylthiotransferase MtaB
MGRNYIMEDYRKIIRVLRERDAVFGLTTDIIVGFPGETEDDFMRSLDAVIEIGFAHVHVFRYSKRSGTKAAEMPDQVPEYIKKERAERLIAAAETAAAEYRSRCEGEVRQALVLGAAGIASDRAGNRGSKNGGESLRVLTDIGIETSIIGGAELINTFTYVTL